MKVKASDGGKRVKKQVIASLVGMLIVLLVISTVSAITDNFWYDLYPNGTENTPTVVLANSEITLKAQLIYYSAGHDYPGTYLTWLVIAHIDGTNVTLSGKDVISPVKTDGYVATFLFEKEWDTGEDEREYTINWEAIIRDNNGVEADRKTTRTYVRVTENPVDVVIYNLDVSKIFIIAITISLVAFIIVRRKTRRK